MTTQDVAETAWRSLAQCPRTSLPWAALGYRVGVHDGAEQVRRALGQAGIDVATKARPLLRSRDWQTVASGHTPDYQPCAARCDRCSRCIASRAYWARGGRPFLGLEQEAAARARGDS